VVSDGSGWAPIGSGQPTTPQRVAAPPGISAIASRRPFARFTLLGMLDEAGRTVRRNARVAVIGSGLLLAPATVASVVTAHGLADRFATADSVVGPLRPIFGSRVSADATRVSEIVALVVGSLCVALIGGFMGELVLLERYGRPVALGPLLRGLLRRSPRLIGGWLLGHGLLVLVLLAVAADQTLGIVAALLGAIPVLLSLYVSPVIVGEQASVSGAWRRSQRLVRQRYDAAIAFALTSAFVGLWLRGWLAGLPALAQATGLVSFGSMRWLAEGVAAQLGVMIGAPIVAAATMLSFIDARVRLEGVDLLVELAET